MPLRACLKCKHLTSSSICDVCKSSNLSSDWSGLFIVIRPESSELAKTLGITSPGRYAIKVR